MGLFKNTAEHLKLQLLLLVTCSLTIIKAQQTISWGPCSDQSLQNAGAECASLDVPLNHSDPNGIKIKIAISRLLHNSSDAEYQGVILTNPGGSGRSKLSYILKSNLLPATVAKKYDWIGFDPRGVGESQPTLSCIPTQNSGPRPNYVARNAEEERYWTEKARKYVEACQQNHLDVLPFMGTRDIVKDMDTIRIALGQRKINYFGFSYGTYLGQVYANLYPHRVRKMVLDSIINSRNLLYKENMMQNIGIDRTFHLWFDWIAKNDDYYHLGGAICDVLDKWNNITVSLGTDPVNGTVGPADWIDAFSAVAYATEAWPVFASVFADWYYDQNVDSVMSVYSNSESDNAYATYLAKLCIDGPWPKGWYGWTRRQWWSYVLAPIYTWLNARYNWPCQYWPVKSRNRLKIRGGNKLSMLLTGATLDGVTLIESAFEVRRRFGKSSLVTVENEPNHGVTFSGNQCVDDIVAEYLGNGTLPSRQSGDVADVVCSHLPYPSPSNKRLNS